VPTRGALSRSLRSARAHAAYARCLTRSRSAARRNSSAEMVQVEAIDTGCKSDDGVQRALSAWQSTAVPRSKSLIKPKHFLGPNPDTVPKWSSNVPTHENINEALQRLRETVKRAEIQKDLMTDERKWNQLCSSMDVIEDTDSAIDAFLHAPASQDLGQLYLQAYGLLQVLYVQQDAITNAAKAVMLGYRLPAELQQVRGIRNRAIGHPTSVRGGHDPQSYGIVQASLTGEGFILYTFDWDKPDAFAPIRFTELIEQQRPHIIDALEQIIQHLLRRRTK
jgi:hypothetical protein